MIKTERYIVFSEVVKTKAQLSVKGTEDGNTMKEIKKPRTGSTEKGLDEGLCRSRVEKSVEDFLG